jgi:hypothetical protein
MSEKIIGIASVVGKDILRITLIQRIVNMMNIKKGDRIVYLQNEQGDIIIRKI